MPHDARFTTGIIIITTTTRWRAGGAADKSTDHIPSTNCPAPIGGAFCFMPLNFSKLSRLLPAVIQDAESGEVLMVGFMNDTALAKTRETGFATFYSRSRRASGPRAKRPAINTVRQILVDCDQDTVLVKVQRLGDGNVCHTGERTCFFRELEH